VAEEIVHLMAARKQRERERRREKKGGREGMKERRKEGGKGKEGRKVGRFRSQYSLRGHSPDDLLPGPPPKGFVTC
jgi:hypothetical protein